jgi:hypothetical protein
MTVSRALAIGLALVAPPAAAEEASPSAASAPSSPGAALDGRNRAGVAAAGVLPRGDWRDATGPAGAAIAWLEVPVSPALTITARAGVSVYAPATIAGVARAWLVEVPVLGGARLRVARLGPVRALLGGDVGLVVAHQRVTLRGVTETDTGLRFGAALVAGLAVDRVALEVGPWLADLTDLDHAVGVQATVLVRLRAW